MTVYFLALTALRAAAGRLADRVPAGARGRVGARDRPSGFPSTTPGSATGSQVLDRGRASDGAPVACRTLARVPPAAALPPPASPRCRRQGRQGRPLWSGSDQGVGRASTTACSSWLQGAAAVPALAGREPRDVLPRLDLRPRTTRWSSSTRRRSRWPGVWPAGTPDLKVRRSPATAPAARPRRPRPAVTLPSRPSASDPWPRPPWCHPRPVGASDQRGAGPP